MSNLRLGWHNTNHSFHFKSFFTIIMAKIGNGKGVCTSTDIVNKAIHSYLIYYFVTECDGTDALVSWKISITSVPAALLARSLLGQVHLMSVVMVVYSLSGQRSLVGQGAESGYSSKAFSGRSSPKGPSLSELDTAHREGEKDIGLSCKYHTGP